MLPYKSVMHWAEDRSLRFFGTDPVICDDQRVCFFQPLRTDSVNRGFCISLLTSEMILLAIALPSLRPGWICVVVRERI